ncbi:Hypothetical protein Y17_2004 [Pectobacterium wasabiae CFBP 3304]|nr:Hypothetical protein Y17_2004 [Pectobacterium wasabiae CFBP 3304]
MNYCRILLFVIGGAESIRTKKASAEPDKPAFDSE